MKVEIFLVITAPRVTFIGPMFNLVESSHHHVIGSKHFYLTYVSLKNILFTYMSSRTGISCDDKM